MYVLNGWPISHLELLTDWEYPTNWQTETNLWLSNSYFFSLLSCNILALQPKKCANQEKRKSYWFLYWTILIQYWKHPWKFIFIMRDIFLLYCYIRAIKVLYKVVISRYHFPTLYHADHFGSFKSFATELVWNNKKINNGLSVFVALLIRYRYYSYFFLPLFYSSNRFSLFIYWLISSIYHLK